LEQCSAGGEEAGIDRAGWATLKPISMEYTGRTFLLFFIFFFFFWFGEGCTRTRTRGLGLWVWV